ncbi:MAG: HAMP domain-containing sensor histidine kinase [Anaerocolumna sp.]
MDTNVNKLIIILVMLTSIILSTGIVLLYRYHMKKTMDKLNHMLDSAIGGNFTEKTYDESKLSSLEAKFNQFLNISKVSSIKLSEEKDKIKSLISDILHQTKTPLANIMLYSQLLLENEQGQEEKQGQEDKKKDQKRNSTSDPDKVNPMYINCIQQIYNQSEKLNFLISALIKTSRLETGIISVVPEPGSVNLLLQSLVEPILPKAAAKNITLTTSDCKGIACFDIKWTTEALYNILDNAVKYTLQGGDINISAIPYEMFYRIDIKDNGIGIAEEEQSKIFGRFYRSQNVNGYEGVGIGLYLAREIISSQGGYIKVNSKPGKGSMFSAFLPI